MLLPIWKLVLHIAVIFTFMCVILNPNFWRLILNYFWDRMFHIFISSLHKLHARLWLCTYCECKWHYTCTKISAQYWFLCVKIIEPVTVFFFFLPCACLFPLLVHCFVMLATLLHCTDSFVSLFLQNQILKPSHKPDILVNLKACFHSSYVTV